LQLLTRPRWAFRSTLLLYLGFYVAGLAGAQDLQINKAEVIAAEGRSSNLRITLAGRQIRESEIAEILIVGGDRIFPLSRITVSSPQPTRGNPTVTSTVQGSAAVPEDFEVGNVYIRLKNGVNLALNSAGVSFSASSRVSSRTSGNIQMVVMSVPNSTTRKATVRIFGKDFGDDKDVIGFVIFSEDNRIDGDIKSLDKGVIVGEVVVPEGFVGRTLDLSIGSAPVESYDIPRSRSDSLPDINVFRILMDPETVRDDFGKRIADQFVVVQVTIANQSPDYDFIVHDLSFDLRDVFPGAADDWPFTLSSQELTLLRGVAEKGQLNDPRNKALRILQGVGTIASGLVGVAFFGKSYAPAISTFNGSVMAAFNSAFPDMTINQINRLNDSAYVANTVVPKSRSKVAVMFVPQRFFLKEEQRQIFKSNPAELWDDGPERVDLRALHIEVTGDMVVKVGEIQPTALTLSIASDEAAKFEQERAEVKATLQGRFLTGATVTAVSPADMTVTLGDGGTDSQLPLILKGSRALPPASQVSVRVSKAGSSQIASTPLTYQVALPSSLDLTIATAEALKFERPNATVKATLVGKGLTGSDVISVSPQDLLVKVDAARTDSQLELTLTSPKPLANGTPITITLQKPGAGIHRVAKPIAYTSTKPTITAVQVAATELEKLKTANGKAEGTITGTNFDLIVDATIVGGPADLKVTTEGSATSRKVIINATTAVAKDAKLRISINTLNDQAQTPADLTIP
jgi:hypothetical protein